MYETALHRSTEQSLPSSFWYRNRFFLLYAASILISFTLIFSRLLWCSVFGLARIDTLLCLIGCMPTIVLFAVQLRMGSISRERLFVLIALPALYGFGLFIVPGGIPDEHVHIAQIFALFSRSSAGMYVPKAVSNGTLPLSYQQLYHCLQQNSSWDALEYTNRYVTYGTHLYFLPFLVVSLCHFAGIHPLLAVYAARFTNAVIYLIAGYQVVKRIPVAKTFTLVYLLNPITIQQCASTSCDAMINVITISFATYVIWLRFKKDKISWHDPAWLGLLTVLLAISKNAAYTPMLLMLLILLNRLEDRDLAKKVFFGIIGAGIILVVAVICLYTGSFLPYAFDLLKQPIFFVKVYLNTIWLQWPFWFESLFGYNLGALDINEWLFVFIAYILLLFTSLARDTDTETFDFNWLDRTTFILVALIDLTLIALSLREWAVTVDHLDNLLTGVQGRYFIPFAQLPFYAFYGRSHLTSKASSVVIVSWVSAFIFATDIATIAAHYFYLA